MPLTEKGSKIMKNMTKQYCPTKAEEPCKKAKKVFYASANKGTIKGVHESLKEFINSLKTSKNETFIESVVLKGFDVCFEDATITQEELEANPDVIKLPDTPDEIEKTKTKLDEIKTAENVANLKKEELKKITDVPTTTI
jgi:hypothetical protein